MRGLFLEGVMPLWIISGVSGSGKSSLARLLSQRLQAPCLDADDYHPPANIAKMRAGQPLDEADREAWLAGLAKAVAALEGREAVLAFPGLKAAHRDQLRQAAGDARFAFLEVGQALAQDRLRQRGGFFPPELAASQFAALEADPGAYPLDGAQSLDALLEQALAWAQPGSCGVVGLGRMGLGLAGRLAAAGFKVWGWDENADARERAQAQGLSVADGLEALAAQLPAPRRLLLSLPAGEATAMVLQALLPGLQAGDLLIDAANARYQDSQDHAAQLAERGVAFVDAGVSGGVFGARAGYCIMAGGNPAAFAKARPLLHACAAPGGLLHVGPAGEGHRVKTVHNGIEYGLMQAYAEGFETLQRSGGGALDLAAIARLWGQGAVVRSWLLELAAAELAQDPGLERYEGRVGENSTGRWAAELAQAYDVPVPALQAALDARARSRKVPSFGSKLLSGLRSRFGGHSEAA
jgi:6-phosphogluconate dehydrogenase